MTRFMKSKKKIKLIDIPNEKQVKLVTYSLKVM